MGRAAGSARCGPGNRDRVCRSPAGPTAAGARDSRPGDRRRDPGPASGQRDNPPGGAARASRVCNFSRPHHAGDAGFRGAPGRGPSAYSGGGRSARPDDSSSGGSMTIG